MTLPKGPGTFKETKDGGEETELGKILKRNNVLEEIDIGQDISDIIDDVRSSTGSIVANCMPFTFLEEKNKMHLEEILCNCFPISLNLAELFMSLVSGPYRTPDFRTDIGKQLIMSTMKMDDIFSRPIHGFNPSAIEKYQEMFREDLCEIYVRAILYFLIASARCPKLLSRF